MAGGCAALVVFSVFKGLVRHPHPWAIAQMLLDYSSGPVKRGLVGTLLAPFISGVSRDVASNRLEVFAFGALAVCVVLVIAACGVLAHRGGADGRWVALLFASAPTLAILGMCLGYLDAVVLGLGFAGVLLSRRSLWPLVVACALAIAAHEIAALLLVPPILVTAIDPNARFGVDRRRMLVAIGVCAAFVVTSLWLFRQLPGAALEQHMRGATVADQHWIGVLLELMRMNLRADWARIGANSNLSREYVSDAVQYLPVAIAIITFGLVRIWRAIPGRARILPVALYLVASLFSIVVVRVAFDFSRLFALTSAQAFLAFFLLARRVPSAELPRWGGRTLSVLATAVLVCAVLQPAHFTFMRPRPRYWPDRWDSALVDPLGHGARAVVEWLR